MQNSAYIKPWNLELERNISIKDRRKALQLQNMLNNWSLEKTGSSYGQEIIGQDNSRKKNGKK